MDSTARELLQRPAGDREAPVAGAMDRVLANIKPYREFIVLVVVLAGAGIGLHDYFITRLEVRVLNCRSLAQIQVLENRMEVELLKPQVTEALLRQLPPLNKGQFKGLSPQERTAVDKYVEGQQFIKRNDAALNAMNEALVRLKAGKCEALVKENKDT